MCDNGNAEKKKKKGKAAGILCPPLDLRSWHAGEHPLQEDFDDVFIMQ